MAVLVYLVLLLVLTGHSSATYCVCKDGVADTSLQKTLDYACGSGADCTPILQNGACYQPNTVKDHCSYAVNSYFQKKGQTSGSCDFAGTAMPSNSPPANVASACVYPASPSNAGTSTTTTPTGTPNTSTTPSGTTTPSSTLTPSSTTPNPSVFVPGAGLGPSGTGINDNGVAPLEATNLFFFASLSLLFSGPFLWWG